VTMPPRRATVGSAPLGGFDREGSALVVEVDFGSTSSRGRAPGRAWLVRIRRGNQTAVVAIGLSRSCAEALAEKITALMQPPPIGGGELQ